MTIYIVSVTGTIDSAWQREADANRRADEILVAGPDVVSVTPVEVQ